jgi:hypothetical protein
MDTPPYFSSTFKRQMGADNKLEYWFSTTYTQSDSNYNEKHPFSVDGEVIYAETSQVQAKSDEQLFANLPEETKNPALWKSIFERWITDCGGAFTKPPTLTQCLANCEICWDSNAPVASMNALEEESDWILQWIPTKIKVHQSRFFIYWAPCYKTLCTRIPELTTAADRDGDAKDKIALGDDADIVLQNPEQSYQYDPENTRRIDLAKKDHVVGLEELTDLSLPLMNSPTLRLTADYDTQKEKYRRRVRDARIRAKLAHYRAERLADRFEARFGYYPEEDEDEAQTEGEQTDDGF